MSLNKSKILYYFKPKLQKLFQIWLPNFKKNLISRLHREALKQSATDPASGRIDVGILTTGLGSAARRRRADLVNALKEIIKPFNKPHTVTHAKLLQEVNTNSQIVSFFTIFICLILIKKEYIVKTLHSSLRHVRSPLSACSRILETNSPKWESVRFPHDRFSILMTCI